MAFGSIRNPSIRDLQQYTAFDPTLEATLQGAPSPQAYAQQLAMQQQRAAMQAPYGAAQFGRTPIARGVRRNLGVDPQLLRAPRGPLAQVGSPRYNAFTAALQNAPSTAATGALPTGGVPTGGPSIPMQGQNVAPQIGEFALPNPPAGITKPVPPGGQFVMGPEGGLWNAAPEAAAAGPFRTVGNVLGSQAPLMAGERQLLSPFKGGALNAVAGAAITGLPQYLPGLKDKDFTSNPQGRIANSFFQGVGQGTGFLGPMGGFLGAAGGPIMQGGFELGKIKNPVLGTAADTAASMIGNAGPLGQAFNFAEKAGKFLPESDIFSAAQNRLESIPGAKKVLGWLGGGGDGGDQAQAQQAQEAQQPVAPQRAYDAKELESLFTETGIPPQYGQGLMEEYRTAIALAKDNPPPKQPLSRFVEEGSKEATGLGAGELVGGDETTPGKQVVSKEAYAELKKSGGYQPTEADVRQQAYQSVADMIPQIKQQQKQDADFILQSTQLQAALAPYINQFAAGYGDTSQYGMLNDAASQLPGNLGAAATNYANVRANTQQQMGDLLGMQLQQIPSQIMLSQQLKGQNAQNDYQSQYDNSLQSAQIQAALHAQHPELFKNSQSGGDAGSISLSP